jgi:hypothetical protein
MQDNNNTNTMVGMTSCPDCGAQVAEMSLTMHRLMGCTGEMTEEDSKPSPMQVDEETNYPKQDIIQIDSDEDANSLSSSCTSPSQRRRLEIPKDNSVVNLIATPPPVAAATTRRTVVDLVDTPTQQQQQQQQQQWACPQCTLLNPPTQPRCDACQYHNLDIARPPDPTRRERLIDDTNGDSGMMHPITLVGGGALLGGMLGAAGSLASGRRTSDILTSAAEGAMTGGIGGAFFNEVMNNTAPGGNNDDLAAARSSAAMGIAGYPSLGNNSSPGSRRIRPRGSFRVQTTRSRNGFSQTVVQQGSTRTTIRRRSTSATQDPVLNFVMRSMMTPNGRNNQNLDNMDYEQILRAFGDGSEHMGGDEGQIQSLPTQVLTQPQKELPEDARQCLICLEDFQAGETRKTLPCLHGFHQKCADKWLRTNASCPICKHRLT